MKRRIMTGVFLLSLFFLVSCGEGIPAESGVNEESLQTGTEETVSIAEEPEPEIDRSAYDWRDGNWPMDLRNGNGTPLYVKEYITGLQYEPDYEYVKEKVNILT